jgi:hypothetical protein
MWLHRHRSVARRPGLDSNHQTGGHFDRRHRRSLRWQVRALRCSRSRHGAPTASATAGGPARPTPGTPYRLFMSCALSAKISARLRSPNSSGRSGCSSCNDDASFATAPRRSNGCALTGPSTIPSQGPALSAATVSASWQNSNGCSSVRASLRAPQLAASVSSPKTSLTSTPGSPTSIERSPSSSSSTRTPLLTSRAPAQTSPPRSSPKLATFGGSATPARSHGSVAQHQSPAALGKRPTAIAYIAAAIGSSTPRSTASRSFNNDTTQTRRPT